jgi:hypothetical protein
MCNETTVKMLPCAVTAFQAGHMHELFPTGCRHVLTSR